MAIKFRSNLIAGSTLSVPDLVNLAKTDGKRFAELVQDSAGAGTLKLSDLHDIRGIFGALKAVQVPVTNLDPGGESRAIMASAFPVLVGSTMVAEVNAAYDSIPSISDQLVREIEDNKKVTTVVNVHALDNQVDEVKDIDKFPEIGASEETFQIGNRLNGRKFTIHQDAIDENDIANIVLRANAIGEFAAWAKEDLTLRRVYDFTGSKSSPAAPYVYKPAGTGTALYSATANTPGTRVPDGNQISSNALVDETDLDAARTRLANSRDANGRRISIPWSKVKLLVPNALLGTALKLGNSELVPGVANEKNLYGPTGQYSITDKIVSSPMLDNLSTGCWFLGWFDRQFIRKVKLNMEYITLGTNTQAYLDSRIAFQARLAWDFEVGAVDYVYVVRNLAATTAPGDE